MSNRYAKKRADQSDTSRVIADVPLTNAHKKDRKWVFLIKTEERSLIWMISDRIEKDESLIAMIWYTMRKGEDTDLNPECDYQGILRFNLSGRCKYQSRIICPSLPPQCTTIEHCARTGKFHPQTRHSSPRVRLTYTEQLVLKLQVRKARYLRERR